MRGTAMLAGTALALGLAVSAMATNPPVIVVTLEGSTPAVDGGAVVRLSTQRAGAQHVRLTVSFSAPLRCGIPIGQVTVALPRAVTLSNAIPQAAVRVNGKPAAKVSVAGHAVTIDSPRPSGPTCNSITDGTMIVEFTPVAGLSNPKTSGEYTLRLRHGADAYTGVFHVT
jgi:hypothetical protein